MSDDFVMTTSTEALIDLELIRSTVAIMYKCAQGPPHRMPKWTLTAAARGVQRLFVPYLLIC